MIVRDLTLRSVQSFGSFHLIRLLYDEFLFYLVEQKVAKLRKINRITLLATEGRGTMKNNNNETTKSEQNGYKTRSKLRLSSNSTEDEMEQGESN